MAQNLPHLPDWEQLSTNVIRIMGGNPSKVSQPPFFKTPISEVAGTVLLCPISLVSVG
jgi:hypothetical protein